MSLGLRLSGSVLFLLFTMSLGLHVHAADNAVFGPHKITRGTGKPVSETHVFAAPASAQTFTLQIINGNETGDSRISSLSLSLNGSKLVTPDQFSQEVGLLEQTVSLSATNILSVQLNGSPGSYVLISLLGGEDSVDVSPTASLTVDPDFIERGQTAVLSWDTNNAETVQLEPGYGVVAPGGSVETSPDATTTYVLRARSGSEEVVSSVTLNVTDQPVAPTVRVSVSPSVITAGEAATLAWSADNADAVTIDPGFGSVPSSGTVEVAPEETTIYTATATNAYAEATARTTLQVQAETAPADIVFNAFNGQELQGTHIAAPWVTISGTLAADLGPDFGVTVNGAVAEVFGAQFVANHVMLQEGWNTITATAVNSQGQTAQAVAEVFAEFPARNASLNSELFNGVAPFSTTFSANLTDGGEVVGSSLECRGPHAVEPQMLDERSHFVQFENPGLYHCRVDVVDTSGQHYQDRLGIAVWEAATLDAVIQAKWQTLKNALASLDVDAAAAQFSEKTMEPFRAQFTALGDNLPTLATRMGPFQLLSVRQNRLVYDLRTTRNGRDYSFQVDFIRDSDGIWRIWTF